MDVLSFSNYLKTKLINESKKYEGNLLSVSFENIADAKQASGIHYALTSIHDYMDKAVSEFYDKNGHPLPVTNSSTEVV